MFFSSLARRGPSSPDGSESEQQEGRSPDRGPRRPCIVCKMRNDNNDLLFHLGGSQLYQCRLCAATIHPSQVQKHIMEIHIKVHRCQICDEGFARPQDLDSHYVRKHPEKTADRFPATLPPGPGAACVYTCEFCEKVFHQEVVFRLHHRMHTGPEPYFCGTCKKRFATNKDLKSHTEHCGNSEGCESGFGDPAISGEAPRSAASVQVLRDVSMARANRHKERTEELTEDTAATTEYRPVSLGQENSMHVTLHPTSSERKCQNESTDKRPAHLLSSGPLGTTYMLPTLPSSDANMNPANNTLVNDAAAWKSCHPTSTNQRPPLAEPGTRSLDTETALWSSSAMMAPKPTEHRSCNAVTHAEVHPIRNEAMLVRTSAPLSAGSDEAHCQEPSSFTADVPAEPTPVMNSRRSRDDVPFACEQCNMTFRKAWCLRTHVRFHRLRKPFSCQYCARTCMNKGMLAAHIAKNHLDVANQTGNASGQVDRIRETECPERVGGVTLQ